MDNWKYVQKDGNPEEAGPYTVVLIHDDGTYSDDDVFTPSGKVLANIEQRWFYPAKKNDEWPMKDQPKEGLAWHMECGSYANEWVYAWLPEERQYPEVELPDGVAWEEEG